MTNSTRFAIPSSALTGWPSPSVMLCGSAKNARYSSDGASTASSGPGTGTQAIGTKLAAMLTINGLEEMRARVGEELGVSDWHEVTQADVARSAALTGDDQWIHTDPEHPTQTPFGATIAHGHYTLSLHPGFVKQIVAFEGFAFAVNYGLNKVRFPAPLPVGNRVRMRATLLGVEDVLG